jgi:hypothetical protein
MDKLGMGGTAKKFADGIKNHASKFANARGEGKGATLRRGKQGTQDDTTEGGTRC